MQPATGAPFPKTDMAVVQGASSDDETLRARAAEDISRLYWPPVYTCLRIQWRLDVDDACDATQEFFSRALTRDLFARYDPSKARFRTWVRLCLDGFMANELKAARREKRGGGRSHLPLDEAEALVERYSHEHAAREDLFDREWLRALIASALEALRTQCVATGKDVQFAMLHFCDVESADADSRPTYSALAERFDVPVTQVTNYLAWARRQFRQHALEALRVHSGSAQEFRDDARRYFGIDVP